MISYNLNNFNTFDTLFEKYNINKIISIYTNEYYNINFSNYSSPCCGKGNLVRHGNYTRYININGDKHPITIFRVRCEHCGSTHAVLPSFIIPYIQTPLYEAMIIIDEYNASDENKTTINTEYKHLIKAYKQWINKLKSIFLSFQNNLKDITISSINTFNNYILQIHRGRYFRFL